MNIPTTKTIKERLDWLDKTDDPDILAPKVRKELEKLKPKHKFNRPSDDRIMRIFNNLNTMLECHGVEYIRHRNDDQYGAYGLTYLNTGDSYVATIIYNHKTDTIAVCSIGDIVEKHMNEYP